MGKKGARNTALGKELGASPPAAVLETLDADELRALTEAIHAARRQQSVALKAAGDKALGNLPWLVRGPVKKIVGA